MSLSSRSLSTGVGIAVMGAGRGISPRIASALDRNGTIAVLCDDGRFLSFTGANSHSRPYFLQPEHVGLASLHYEKSEQCRDGNASFITLIFLALHLVQPCLLL